MRSLEELRDTFKRNLKITQEDISRSNTRYFIMIHDGLFPSYYTQESDVYKDMIEGNYE